jgi:hypothetical protein
MLYNGQFSATGLMHHTLKEQENPPPRSLAHFK